MQESFPSRSKLVEIGCTHNAIVRCRIRYNGDGIINETSATNLGQGVAMGFPFENRHLHLLPRSVVETWVYVFPFHLFVSIWISRYLDFLFFSGIEIEENFISYLFRKIF